MLGGGLKPEVTMARKQQDNAPAAAAQPAYKVFEREKDRWWQVCAMRGASWCA